MSSPISPEARRLRAELGRAVRFDPERAPAARRDYAAVRLMDHIAALTKDADPFTPAQADRLVNAIRGGR
ncbi:Uncharacterised protein [Nocardia cyriacigeorgica]|uniref:Uncharacterized protein n=1 Tax=Nocardia cyriacigeorgica TaxID=135487 RepID=A0A4U8W6B4_9NOCA|nr:Uncharacterised protein [Nocardia cyriacigeorgica]